MNFKHTIIYILFLFSVSPILAQSDLMSNLQRGSWSAYRTNPALLPARQLTIALPEVYSDLWTENATYGDIVQDDGVFNADLTISKLEQENRIREQLDIHTIGAGLHIGNLYLSAGHQLRSNAYINFPKALPQLIWQGNAQFIGQEVAFGPDLDLNSYHELSAGAAYRILEVLVVGGRFKYLMGVADAHTERSDLRLFTDDDVYQLTLNGDFLLNSTGSVDLNGFEEPNINFNPSQFKADQDLTANTGTAFDIGLALELDKLHLSAAILDIGAQIEWSEGARNYGLQGDRAYKGLDIGQELFSDTTEIGGILDTLENLYQFDETTNAYTTEYPTRMYLQAGYQLLERWRLGVSFYQQQYRDQTYTAAGAAAHYRPMDWLEVGASYMYRNGEAFNIGLSTQANLGPVYLFVATDNVLGLLDIEDAHNATARVGLSVQLGPRIGVHGK